MDKEEIKGFYEDQLKSWQLAFTNFKALEKVERKPILIGQIEGFVQFNPARAVSTLAKVDKETIKKRECFLCGRNRPKEQKSIEILPGWELLINPYPILPYHFTIAGINHEDQALNVETGLKLAEAMPGWVVFYNDAGAGASAPDHIHFQAVPMEALPIIDYIEKKIKKNEKWESLPFRVLMNSENIEGREYPVNAYFWKSSSGKIHFIAIPRKAHRPDLYYKEPPARRAVSPGAIDMAGIVVCPIKDDYDSLSQKEVDQIFSEVSFVNENK